MFATGFAIDPTNPQIVYAATGAGIFKTDDGASSWAPANSGLPSNSNALTLVLEPGNPQRLYTSSFNGVFKSVDGAGSWMPITIDSGFTDQAFAFDPAASQTIYAGGSTSDAEPTGLEGANVLALAIAPAVPHTLYAGTARGAQPGGIFMSTDNGATWTSTTIANFPSSAGVTAIVLDSSADGILYAGSSAGVFKSTDSGANWMPMNSGLGVDTAFGRNLLVFALALDPSKAQTLYAGLDGGGVFKSNDGGNSWTPFSTALGNQEVLALVFDVRAPQTLYAGTRGGGVFLTHP